MSVKGIRGASCLRDVACGAQKISSIHSRDPDNHGSPAVKFGGKSWEWALFCGKELVAILAGNA